MTLFNSKIFILNLKLLLTSRIYPRYREGAMARDVDGTGLAMQRDVGAG